MGPRNPRRQHKPKAAGPSEADEQPDSPEPPSHVPRRIEEYGENTQQTWSQQKDRMSVASSPGANSEGDLSYTFGSLGLSESTAVPSESTFTSPPSAQNRGRTGGQIYYAPKESITDSTLLNKGYQARARVIGSKEQSEPLDPRYVRQSKPRLFFTVGRVIKVLWSEPIGFNGDNLTVVTMEKKYDGEQVAVKIRWFVVIMEGDKWCTCLPISTYGGRGLRGKDLHKWQHSVIYTGRRQPDLSPGEVPRPGEHGFRLPIQVRQHDRQTRMDSASRLHYAKMYTIEHNVKVFDFGMVVPEHIPVMVSQWKQVMGWTQLSDGTGEASASTDAGYTGSHTYNNSSGSYNSYRSASGEQSGYGYGGSSQYQAGAEASYSSQRGSYYGQPAPSALGQLPEGSLNEQPEDDAEDQPEGEQEEAAGNEDDDEEQIEDEDRVEEGAVAPPPDPFIDYAQVIVAYQPNTEALAQQQIPIAHGQRLGIYEGYASGWYKCYNHHSGEVGLVWKGHVYLDSQAPAQ